MSSKDRKKSPSHSGPAGQLTQVASKPTIDAGKRPRTTGLPPRTAASRFPVQYKSDPATDAARKERAEITAQWVNTLTRPDLYPPPVQRKGTSEAVSQTSSLETGGSGQPMPEDVQAKMGHAFSADFSAVRIHEGPQATAMGALAYTQGTNIYFAPGQYAPSSQGGQQLLGHELTHVVQQSRGRVNSTRQAKGVAINDDVALEREADEMGAKAARGERVDARVGAVNASMSTSAPAQFFADKPANKDAIEWRDYLDTVIAELEQYIGSMDPSVFNRIDVTDMKKVRILLETIPGKKECSWFLSPSNPAYEDLAPLYATMMELKGQAKNLKITHKVDKDLSEGVARPLTLPENEALQLLDVPLSALTTPEAQTRIIEILGSFLINGTASLAFVRLIGHVLHDCHVYANSMLGLDEHIVKISQQNDVSGYKGFVAELQVVCELAKTDAVTPEKPAKLGEMMPREELWPGDSREQDVDIRYGDSSDIVELVEVKDECLTLSIKMNKEIGPGALLGRDPSDSRQLESLKQVRFEVGDDRCHLTFWCVKPRGWVRLVASENGQQLIDSNCDLVIDGVRFGPAELDLLRQKTLELVESKEKEEGITREDAYWELEGTFALPTAIWS